MNRARDLYYAVALDSSYAQPSLLILAVLAQRSEPGSVDLPAGEQLVVVVQSS